MAFMTNTTTPSAADVRLLSIGQIDPIFSADDDLAVLETPLPPKGKEMADFTSARLRKSGNMPPRQDVGRHGVAFKLATEKVDRLVSWSRRVFGVDGNPVARAISAAVREYIRRRPDLAAMAGDVSIDDRDVSGRDALLLLEAARGAKARPAHGQIVLGASIPARDALALAKIGNLLMPGVSLDSMACVAVEEFLARKDRRR